MGLCYNVPTYIDKEVASLKLISMGGRITFLRLRKICTELWEHSKMTLVMVVDDDQDLSEMLAIVLTGAGIDVDLVSRGDEALEVFRNNPPDLVLLDVMLPGLDGIEVCRLIRAESMVPIIMLSAKGDSHDVVRGLEVGADDYMVKPFKHPSELIARIRTRLRRTNLEILGF